MLIIGIDCATDPKKMGLACARYKGNQCTLIEAMQGTSHDVNIGKVANWLRDDPSALLCVDAPLGWPQALGDELVRHSAGEGLSSEANLLFRRETDMAIYSRLKKQPLDVGADRIARTARAALGFLDDLRSASSYPLPLMWSHESHVYPSIIEVYPAATLVAHGMRSSGYKKRENDKPRQEIVAALAQELTLPKEDIEMRNNADALDAAVCVLAGLDFLRGLSPEPEDTQVAQREGWIWVKA